MAVRNQEWYNQNESQPYPVQDSSTLRDNAGESLPSDIVCDLNLAFPNDLGLFAYVGDCCVTDHLVSVVILGSQSATSASSPTRLASITLQKPVDLYRPYLLDDLADGVGGWIVFGTGVNENYRGRFSSPAQSLISPRAARAYLPPPVLSIGEFRNARPLTGIVKLLAGPDISLSYESVAELSSNAIVVRLADTSGQGTGRNVFDLYKGPCGARPESKTCGDPQPVEFLGPVPPDCCGRITLELSGCAVISHITTEQVLTELGEVASSANACGIVVDCAYGLSDVCGDTKAHIPGPDGRMPNEADDECSIMSLTLADSYLPATDPPWAEEPTCVDLPYPADMLADISNPTLDLTTLAGSWDDASYNTVLMTVNATANNGISARVFNNDKQTICRTYVGTFTLRATPPSNVRRRIGLIFGYNPLEFGQFHCAEVVWDPIAATNVLRIRYYDGWGAGSAVTQEITVGATDITEGPITLTVRIDEPTGLDGAVVTATMAPTVGSLVVTDPATRAPCVTGRFGVLAENQSVLINGLLVSDTE